MRPLVPREATSQPSLAWVHLNPGLLPPRVCPLTLFLSLNCSWAMADYSMWNSLTANEAKQSNHFLVKCFSQKVTCCSSASCMYGACLCSHCWCWSVSILQVFWNTCIYLAWISLILARLSAREAGTVRNRIEALNYKLCILNYCLLLVWDLLLVHIFTDDTASFSPSWRYCALYCNITMTTAEITAGRNLPFPRKRVWNKSALHEA